VRNPINTKYLNHKHSAKQRGILFDLTFDQWYDIWQQSGKWDLRGKGKGTYVMSRIGDTGGYTLSNVYIQSNSSNVIEGNKNRIITDETKTKLSNTHKKICDPKHIIKMHAARYGHIIKETI
jgi:hypothetical protein